MRMFCVIVVCCISLGLAGCGGGHSYRSMNTMKQAEFNNVTAARHTYAKCVLNESLKLDDGTISPQLIVKNGQRNCEPYAQVVYDYLRQLNFSPVESKQYVANSRKEESRKVLESVLRLRVE